VGSRLERAGEGRHKHAQLSQDQHEDKVQVEDEQRPRATAAGTYAGEPIRSGATRAASPGVPKRAARSRHIGIPQRRMLDTPARYVSGLYRVSTASRHGPRTPSNDPRRGLSVDRHSQEVPRPVERRTNRRLFQLDCGQC
jgi:hypothetical protein